MPQWGVSLGRFYHIFLVCGHLHGWSYINIWADSLNGFRTYGGLNLGRAFYPKFLHHFFAPFSGKAVCRM